VYATADTNSEIVSAAADRNSSASAKTNGNSAAIAAALKRRGVFPEPAAHIAGLMAAAGLDAGRAVELFLAQMADTGNSLALTVWRLRQSRWEPSAETEARVAREARAARYAQSQPEPGNGRDREPAGDDLPAAAGPDESVHEPVAGGLTAAQVWQAALGELELQMTRATFDAWLRGTWLAAYDGETFTVAVASTYAVDWLAHRLNDTVLRTLRRLAGQERASVRFVVAKEIVEEVDSVQEA
jgi:hypothetical protein